MVHNACFMKTKQLKEELQQACVITSVEGYHHGYFSTDILTCQSRRSAGVNINNGFIPFSIPVSVMGHNLH